MKGTFYGVSVGPGEPELMTLQAVRLLKQCAVIAVPQTKNSATVALDIASQAVDLSGKTLIMLPFLMSKDEKALAERHRQLAETLKAPLDGGLDVAMLCLGDVSVYASFSYMAALLKPQGYSVKASAGVTSFCAAAAALGTSLTEMNKPLHIFPAALDVEQALTLSGTRVLMKSGRSLPQLLSKIKERGLLKKSALVQNCGLPNERVLKNIPEDFEAIPPDYFSIVIIKE